jgi:transcriptional regulator with XRE-family HTH domain
MPKKRTLTPGASPLHHFGSEVRRAREAAGLTLAELGALVPCDNSTVSRIESGLISPDAHFAEVCDEAFPEMSGWFTRFYTDSQGWGAAFPPALREFAAYEAEAVTLWTFEHSLIPGLLQTPGYARAVLSRHPHVTDDQVAERVAARMARQAVLDRDEPPVFWVLIDESALHREIGNSEIMADQLGRLMTVAERPTVTIQLVSRIGAHVGLLGAFVIAETDDSHVAYLDHIADGVTTDSPAIVGQVSTRFDVLRTEAYKGTESLKMIEAAAESWNSA